MIKPKSNAPINIIGFLGDTGTSEEYASSITLALSPVMASEMADSSLFCNNSRYSCSLICCCLSIFLNSFSIFGSLEIFPFARFCSI